MHLRWRFRLRLLVRVLVAFLVAAILAVIAQVLGVSPLSPPILPQLTVCVIVLSLMFPRISSRCERILLIRTCCIIANQRW